MPDYEKKDILDTADYSQLTTDVFAGILEGIVAGLTPSTLLAIPGVYEALAEELNNDVLDTWAQANPDKAYPNRKDDEGEEDDQ